MPHLEFAFGHLLRGGTEALLRQTDSAYKDITGKLYQDYKERREIISSHPQMDFWTAAGRLNGPPQSQLVTGALVMAIWRRGKPDALLQDSDCGSQYTSKQSRLLDGLSRVICSMSR